MSRRVRGVTLVEVLVASAMTSMTLLVSLSIFLVGMSNWYRGQGRINAESSSQLAVRKIARELREAMSVTVDGDGMGLSYRLPQTDSSGAYVMPITWDGISRRIEMRNNAIQRVTGSAATIFCDGVITTDPLSANGTASYKLFQPGTGSITRSITAMVVTQKASYRTDKVTSRSRETIYLRNIPELTK